MEEKKTQSGMLSLDEHEKDMEIDESKCLVPGYHRQTIRTHKSNVVNHIESKVRDMIMECMEYAGKTPYGIVTVLTGGFDDQGTFEWWDRDFQNNNGSEALSRLVDHSRHDYVKNEVIIPGVGLLGLLWVEAPWGSLSSKRNPILWRDLESIANDPDQCYDLRLQLTLEAGIHAVAAVPLQSVSGIRGLVVFGARKTADPNMLRSRNNENLLTDSAQVVGSLITFLESFWTAREQKLLVLEKTMRKARSILLSGTGFKTHQHVEEKKTGCTILKDRYKMWLEKLKGASTPSPPVLPWRNVVWSFCGCFITFFLWALLNKGIMDVSDDKHKLTRGSFGSLVAAQFLLFASPAAQPFNALFSEIITGAICLSINYIPHFPVLIRGAFSPALCIAIIGKIGCVHPTAGADALLFALDGTKSWSLYGLILVNYVFAIIMATLINNSTRNRQYPNYWLPKLYYRDDKVN